MSERTPHAGRIYIGNLPDDVSREELEDFLYKYGRVNDIDIKHGKTSNGTAYAFAEFEDPRDAEDAVKGRDGVRFDRNRVRVEFAGRGRGGGPPPRRGRYRVEITGLSRSVKWQELKDHMRRAGHVCYADIDGSVGVVEYESRREMEDAVDRLDRTEIGRSKIRVREAGSRRDSRDRRSRDRGSRDRRSRDRRSRSYSSSSRSRSYSSCSRSYSRSRSRRRDSRTRSLSSRSRSSSRSR